MQLLSILRGAFDESPWYGYVVAESPELLAIHTVSDRYDLDGYRVFRQGDITERKESFNRRELIETALRLKGLAPHAPSTFELFGMRELIESVQGTYGAVIINQEALRSHEVEVGAVRMATRETYVLRGLTPNAEWENDDRPFRYRDITMLEFGGEYEETLVMVANARSSRA